MGVIKVAGDGDCLFHALAFFDFSDGAALRIEVADFMDTHAAEQAGFEEEWRREVVKLRQNKWGGHNVVAAYSLMKQRRVTIHTRRDDGAVPPVVVQEASHGLVHGNDAFPMVHILYNGKDHYDALVEVFDKSNAQPAWPQPPPPMYFQVVGNKETTGAKDFPSLEEAAATSTKAGSKAGNKKGLEGPRPQQAGKAKAKAKSKAKAKAKAKAKGKAKPKAKPSPAAPSINQSQDPKPAGNEAEDGNDQSLGKALEMLPEEMGEEESMEPGLMENLEAFPVASTSDHPHRKAEDLIKDSARR